MGIFGTGQAIRRVEDQRFLTGGGQYTDDIVLDNQAFLYLFRSPYAHGRICTLDVSAASTSPGVIAVYTGTDLLDAGVRDVTGGDQQKSSISVARLAKKQPPLARDRVRYVGEPLVGIIAETLTAAKDAAELIEVDIEELPASVSVLDALQDGAELVHEDIPGNSLGHMEYGNRGQADAAFAKAARTIDIDVVNNRLAPTAMEPRGCNARFDASSGVMTVYQGCQGVHRLRQCLLESFDLSPETLRIVSPDVGGAFGLKFFLQCETVIACHAAMQLGRPVKWNADRTESFLSDLHGRDHVSHAELALDIDGRFLAMRVSIRANMGAYCSQGGTFIPWWGACMSTGCYDIPHLYVDVHNVFSNTVPVDAYRGAGRPEATYLLERLVDKCARQIGVDPDVLRRRNFVAPQQFPYRSASDRSYDSGEYERLMDGALARSQWNLFEDRREQSATRNLLRGIGMSYYVEICSAAGGEDTHVRFESDGRVTVLMGTQSTGQGHETSFAQMIAAGLGVAMSRIDVIQGDSFRIPTGEGTGGSRTMVIGGSSLYRTVDSMIESGRRIAAEILETSTADIDFENGEYRVVGTDRTTRLDDVATASFDDALRPDDVQPGLASSERFAPESGTFPNGCHICEVEIDPETGAIDIVRYTVEDDVGTVVNPLILEGQIMGGVAQGLGQAMGEHAVYDKGSGQLITASFMDYTMPRADWVPDIDFRYQEVPSPTNPLGVKGAGEAGTIGAAPAIVNAVMDALAVHGVEHIDMPLTPLKVWEALHTKKRLPGEPLRPRKY